ncbi:MFS transporter [Pseudomonas sp. PB105]|uniref:MFS transporter n=1 Tax=Pseudomonas TaxID=286 RepID=UPI00131AB34B|nr:MULTISPECIES: MFS transporter [Pseudomonas]KAE9654210.1 MFS transporter [Pseudomonas sp. PB105]MBD8236040.1 MFS transporter [Pseudomonas fluorescens]MCM2362636.1 MFS transporter [Pseudomonas sp. SR18]MDY0894736.1 MFS transporter [Pseudomonas fluorescens]MVW94847.1 MFS transporter [Pseudomonas sp. PB100]
MPFDPHSPTKSIILLALIFTACNATTHGFSIFLYSALLPQIRQVFELSYSQAASIAALLQLFYMGASIASGIAAAWISPRNMVKLTMALSPALLALAVATPWVLPYALSLALVSACAVANWNAIAALVGEVIPVSHRSRVLGLASSGAAFAICLNGLLIALLQGISLRHFWLICAGLTLMVTLLTFWVLAPLAKGQRTTKSSAPSLRRILRQWLKLCLEHPVALHVLLLSTFIGGISGPFLNFLSAFASERLGANAQITGSLWTLIGIGGAVGGLLLGSFADRWGALRVMALSISAFGLAMLALLWQPSLNLTWLAAGLFALFYFPVWGLMAAYLSARLSPVQSLQVVSLSMVGYGLGSATANWLCGWLLQATGQFGLVHGWIVCWVTASLLLLRLMARRQRCEPALGQPL